MSQHRATVILAMDVTGGTEESLELLRGLAGPHVAESGGVVLDRLGQSIMTVEFDDAVGALTCATKIFSAVQAHNSGAPEEARIRMRAALHQGIVTDTEAGPKGEPVDAAIGLRLAKDGGGVFLTRSVHDAVKGRSNVKFDALGAKSVKKVVVPLEVFMVSGTGHVEPDHAAGPEVDLAATRGEHDDLDEEEIARRKSSAAEVAYEFKPSDIELTTEALKVDHRTRARPGSYSAALDLERSKPGRGSSFVVRLAALGVFLAVFGGGTVLFLDPNSRVRKIYEHATSTSMTAGEKIATVIDVFYRTIKGEDVVGIYKKMIKDKLAKDPDGRIVAAGGADPLRGPAAAATGADAGASGGPVTHFPAPEPAPVAQAAALPEVDASKPYTPDPAVVAVMVGKCPSNPELCDATAATFVKSKAMPQAAKLYGAACDAGLQKSCRALGELYASGEGVDRSPARARQLLDGSCAKGDEIACREAKDLK